MGQYVKKVYTDEVLAGAPTYDISGTPAQTIALETAITTPGTDFNAAGMNNSEIGILRNDYDNRYTVTGSSVVTDHIAYTLSQGGTVTAEGTNERFVFEANERSFQELTGTLTLDGIDDYGVLPASVGQLIDGSDPFELIIKFNCNDGVALNRVLMSKKDTGYSATNIVKGWSLIAQFAGSDRIILQSTGANGTAYSNMLMNTSTISLNVDTWVKLSFDGTFVRLSVSIDGVNYTGEKISTTANLISGLSISDNVDTQVGREWDGSGGYTDYFKNNIYNINVSKNSVDTNEYLFGNTGTDKPIRDNIGFDDGSSFNGAVQVGTETTGTPTLSIDGLTAKTLQGSVPIVAGSKYEAVYNGVNFDVALSVQELGNLVAEETLSGASVTISGLDVNADGNRYIVEIEGIPSQATFIEVQFNGLTSNIYYTALNSASSSTATDAIRLGVIYVANAGNNIIAYFSQHNNNILSQASNVSFTGTELLSTEGYNGVCTGQANLTSMTFITTGGTFSSGTVKIYKR